MSTNPSMGKKSESNYNLHVKLSPKYKYIIKKFSLSYGTIQKVIEEAVDLLFIKNAINDKFVMENLQKDTLDEYKLSHLMLNDFKMMAVGRRTFMSYIDAIPDMPIEENNAIELIEWFYDGKIHINSLSLFQILKAVKNLWISGKYFNNVKIIPLDNEEMQKSRKFKVIFTHDFNNKNFGKYWAKYFKYVLSNIPNHFEVDQVTVRNQSFYLQVEQEKLVINQNES